MDNVLHKYPDRVPVIVDDESDFHIDRRKYLIPRDMTLGNFVSYIRKRVKIKGSDAMFIIIGDILPPISSTFETLYTAHSSEDKLLHIVLKKENTFG